MTPVDASVTSTGNSELSSLDIAKIQARPDNLAVWTGCTCIVKLETQLLPNSQRWHYIVNSVTIPTLITFQTQLKAKLRLNEDSKSVKSISLIPPCPCCFKLDSYTRKLIVVLVLVLLCQVTSPHMASASTIVTESAPAPAGATNKVRRNIGDYR